jgi:hypothetical protein
MGIFYTRKGKKRKTTFGFSRTNMSCRHSCQSTRTQLFDKHKNVARTASGDRPERTSQLYGGGSVNEFVTTVLKPW